ncbi:hypothetical protein HD554DRAFT_2172539 [Boletus coccyginus]|nr:hypothetical protein HD554DRAFT_2172539 [Boletus coccyginus]
MPKDSSNNEKLVIRIRRPYEKGGNGLASGRSNAGRSGAVRIDGPGDQGANSDQSLVVSKEYCCFCGDFVGKKVNICSDCGACVCEQTAAYGRGCIYFGTVLPNATFRCPICDAKHWRVQPSRPKAGLPYGFLGSGGRKRAKLTWPLVLVNVTLSTAVERFVQDSLKLEFKQQYLASPDNLLLVDIDLKVNGQAAALKEMEPVCKFIDRSTQSTVPANTFFVVDTHSDTLTGGLQWAGGVTAPKMAPASELLSEFCGKPVLGAMMKAAEASRRFVPPENPGWYKDSPLYRGGWRGLLLATCGPAVRVPSGFKDLRGFVDRDEFDFVLAFGGCSTISHYAKGTISQAIEGVGVDNTGGLWESLSRLAGRELKQLQMNTVVLIYRERGEGVKCRQIGLHQPPMRAWGVEFSACGKEGCRPTPYDFDIRDSGGRVHFTCRLCHWRSAALRDSDLKGLVFRLSSSLPDVYWHDYPPSMELQDALVRATKHKTAGEKR